MPAFDVTIVGTPTVGVSAGRESVIAPTQQVIADDAAGAEKAVLEKEGKHLASHGIAVKDAKVEVRALSAEA